MIRVLSWIDRRFPALLVGLLLAVLAVACARLLPDPPKPPPSSAPPASAAARPAEAAAPPAATDVDALRAQLAALDGERAALRTRLRAAESEATLAPLRALTAWATWIGGAVALLSVAALVLLRVGVGLPVGARLIAGIGVAGLSLAAAAMGLGQALPWLGPVGLGALALLVLGGVGWAAYTWRRAGGVAAAQWKEYAARLPADVREILDRHSRDAQGRLAGAVDALLGSRT